MLVPKAADVGAAHILKVRVDGDRPAFFEFIAAKGANDKGCYYHGMYGPGSGGGGGVVCPSFNWDYKRNLSRY